MKRFHIHIGVEKLDESIRFYSKLFGADPVKTKPDYAKWMLDDPRVNFAISTRSQQHGVDHLGIQVEEESELNELRSRFETADLTVLDARYYHVLLRAIRQVMSSRSDRHTLGGVSDNGRRPVFLQQPRPF